MSWQTLEEAVPELARFGREQFRQGPAFLATVRKDGSPRVHPVTPYIGGGRLFVFMDPTSPKRFDLLHDGRFAMHAHVGDNSGGRGEFFISGKANLVEDPAARAIANQATGHIPPEHYLLFEFDLNSAFAKTYPADGPPQLQRWQPD